MSTLDSTNITQKLLISYSLNFTNCTEAVCFWKFSDPGRYAVNPTLANEYLLDGLQDFLKTNHLAQPNMTEITAWKESPDVELYVLDYTRRECGSEVCPLLGWEGNPDVAGLGISFSYSLYTVRY
jgi:hypothetical protein